MGKKVLKHSKAHPGFSAEQSQIASDLMKKGMPAEAAIKRAGAILASGARNASPAAKKKNPRLKRVAKANSYKA